MASPFDAFEVAAPLRPKASAFEFDLDHVLSSVVALEAFVPEDAFTAGALGTERIGNGVVINDAGLVLTIGYLITEAEKVVLSTVDGRKVQAHPLGYDQKTGFGLVQALEPLDLPPLPIGDSRRIGPDDPVIVAGGGGRAHALAGRIVARESFAGYWEYFLDEALFTGPDHPHWSGAALIGPEGQLIGIGSLRVEQGSSEGATTPVNMSVPAELLPPILDELARGRPPGDPRPWLGVFAQDNGSNVVILDVAKGGPASRAELRRGDVVLAVDDQPVSTLGEFYHALWQLGPAGVEVPLKLWRGGDVFDVELRSTDRSALLKKRRLN